MSIQQEAPGAGDELSAMGTVDSVKSVRVVTIPRSSHRRKAAPEV